MIELLTLVLVPLLVAGIAAAPLWVTAIRTRRESSLTRQENSSQHGETKDAMIGVQTAMLELTSEVRSLNTKFERHLDDRVAHPLLQ